MSYLRTRIADWDVSIWHPDQQTPSKLERRLRMRSTESESARPRLTPEEALAGQRMLVVLGGPGSGKSRLAHRYARVAAQTAMRQLEDGAHLNSVEVPLLTTWNQWAHTPGHIRQSLVDASISSGLDHRNFDEAGSIARLQRTITEPGSKVLLVVDSLDEAADHAGQANRLRELASLQGWRVVVTSRPAAWDAAYRGGPEPAEAPRVVELQDLTYPIDVETFIRHWFAARPGPGNTLIRQIRERADLARVAVIPLWLTFYCLLAEEPAAESRPLPARRRELFGRLVRRLLSRPLPARGEVSERSMSRLFGSRRSIRPSGSDNAPDINYCEAVLMHWAWQAAGHRVTPVGLGDWGEVFTQQTAPRHREATAIDPIAPKVTEDGEGRITRHFVHRTILEHFVAEHIATLDAVEAADVLLPHLWFDPDWSVTAPAAIAAHNRRQQGTLLRQLLNRGRPPVTDSARQAAHDEFDKLLLAIAEESEPAEWNLEHQAVLHDCRERTATSHLPVMVRTAHWVQSNRSVRATMIAALRTADSSVVGDLVTALLALDATDTDRADARAAVLTALPATDPPRLNRLVAALVALDPTVADLADARAAVLIALPTANPWAVSDLVTDLLALDATDADRARARAALIADLPAADPSTFRNLAETLSALSPTDADRVQALTALATDFTPSSPWQAVQQMLALPALNNTDGIRAEVHATLLAILATNHQMPVREMVAALPALVDNGYADPSETRAALLAAFPGAHQSTVCDRMAALLALEATDVDLAEARAGLLTALTATQPWECRDLLEMLLALHPADADRAQARAALIGALPNAEPWVVRDLLAVLPALDPTAVDQEHALAAVLGALPTARPAADPLVVRDLLAALPALDPTAVDRKHAVAAVLGALPNAEPWVVSHLLAALPALDPTDADRAQARTAVLGALRNAEPWVVSHLLAALRALDPTDRDREHALAVVLAALPNAEPWVVSHLLAALPALHPTDADRAQARTAVLAALPTAPTAAASNLVAALRSTFSIQSWMEWLGESTEGLPGEPGLHQSGLRLDDRFDRRGD